MAGNGRTKGSTGAARPGNTRRPGRPRGGNKTRQPAQGLIRRERVWALATAAPPVARSATSLPNAPAARKRDEAHQASTSGATGSVPHKAAAAHSAVTEQRPFSPSHLADIAPSRPFYRHRGHRDRRSTPRLGRRGPARQLPAHNAASRRTRRSSAKAPARWNCVAWKSRESVPRFGRASSRTIGPDGLTRRSVTTFPFPTVVCCG